MSPARPSSVSARVVLGIGCVSIGLLLVPRWLCGREADRYFDGDLETQDALARSVARSVGSQSGRHFYHTKSTRFDGQSAIAIYQMTIMGLAQIILQHPERRDAYLGAMDRAAEHLVDPKTLDYAASVYGQHGLNRLDTTQGHAYLGYINLALGMLRAVDGSTRFAALHDRLSAALAERLKRAPNGLIETYPGETWPPDVAAVAGSVGLHARVTGVDRRALLDAWAKRFAACAVSRSGYLVQRVRTGSCVPADAPRGSGTAVAAYFIGFAAPELAAQLQSALRREGERSLLGFSAIREYAPGYAGRGDTNAGPVLFGVSVGATGFALGAARLHGDRELYRNLFRTLYLFGVPADIRGERTFAIGGTLGNALLLAMLTARRP